MTISLGNAIACIKEDKKWVSKCIIGAIIGYVIPFIVGGAEGTLEATGIIAENSLIGQIIMYTISFIIGLYISGFVFTTMNRVINSSEPFKMANWNEKNLLLTGLKVTFSCIGWAILTLLVFGIGLIVVALGCILVGSLICALLKICLNIDLEIIKLFIVIISSIIGIIYGLYLAQFMNAAFACFLKTFRFKDFIAFKKHFRIIKENKHASWTLVGKGILYSLLIIFLVLALSITIVGIILLPFICFAGEFVAYNLCAQYAKEIKIDRYLEN